MANDHDTDMAAEVPACMTEWAESINYTPDGASQLVGISAIVDRHAIEPEASATRKDAVHRATLHLALADVAAPTIKDKATFDLFVEGGSNSVVWSVTSPGEIAGGMAVVEVEYKITDEHRRDGHRQST